MDRLTTWPEHLRIRRASVNSFGYGGSNAHVIVEAVDSVLMQYAPSIPARLSDLATQRRQFLLPFSAHDLPTARRNVDVHRAYVEKSPALLDVAYTLSARRTAHKARAFVVTQGGIPEDAVQTGEVKKAGRRLAFVFTGQGAQWPRMGAELLREFPSVQGTIRRLDGVLRSAGAGGWTLEEAILAEPGASRIHEVQQSQPVCTAVQVAIVDLLRSWGVTPVATVGHSSGLFPGWSPALWLADIV